jgi:hypothetical protein
MNVPEIPLASLPHPHPEKNLQAIEETQPDMIQSLQSQISREDIHLHKHGSGLTICNYLMGDRICPVHGQTDVFQENQAVSHR